MYWRLTSKEKPVKKCQVIVAWQKDKYEFCIYNADKDVWGILNSLKPYCWSYIDELPSEEE